MLISFQRSVELGNRCLLYVVPLPMCVQQRRSGRGGVRRGWSPIHLSARAWRRRHPGATRAATPVHPAPGSGPAPFTVVPRPPEQVRGRSGHPRPSTDSSAPGPRRDAARRGWPGDPRTWIRGRPRREGGRPSPTRRSRGSGNPEAARHTVRGGPRIGAGSGPGRVPGSSPGRGLDPRFRGGDEEGWPPGTRFTAALGLGAGRVPSTSNDRARSGTWMAGTPPDLIRGPGHDVEGRG